MWLIIALDRGLYNIIVQLIQEHVAYIALDRGLYNIIYSTRICGLYCTR